MDELIFRKMTNKLVDWLIVLLGVVLILWYAFTLPVFTLFTDKASSSLPNVSESKLKMHVTTLIHDYAPRTVDYGNLNITAHYIHDEFSKFGYTQYQPFSTLSGRYSNVVLNIGPKTKEVFVIGAHYDAENNSLDIDGNASGIATLIELARHLSKVKDQLAINVQLVAFPLSQVVAKTPENMGSYNHAESLVKTQKSVHLMISLDGVGNFNDSDESQQYPYQFMRLFYPNKGDYISLIGRLEDYSQMREMKSSFTSATALPLYSFNVPSYFSPTNSRDHLNYQHFGFPSVLLTDTAKYRKPLNAQKNIIEQMDYKKMALLVKSLYRVVLDSDVAMQEVRIVRQKPLILEKSSALQ